MVYSQKALLQDDSLGLKLNSLQVVTEVELDLGDALDAIRNLLVHSARDLQKHVDCLRVELKRPIKLVLSL